jgi:hypothetical protein
MHIDLQMLMLCKSRQQLISMNTFTLPRQIFAILGVAFLASSLNAQFVGVSGATSAPPTVFGGFTMTQFTDDVRPVYQNVTTDASPLGGSLGFSTALRHLEIGSSWATWSNGYKGDVYFLNGHSTLTLTLPDFTTAFYFYAEPNDFASHRISASSGSTTLTEQVRGQSGAEFFGFYATGSAVITSITISSNDFSGFAIGEFGIAKAASFIPTPSAFPTPVPEPSTYALFGAAALCGLVIVRRFRRTQS